MAESEVDAGRRSRFPMTSLLGRHHRLLLELDLTQLPADPPPDDPLARFRARGRSRLRPILQTLHEAGDDRRVGGLVAKVGGSLPWAGMQELRLGVEAFTRSGKVAVAWAESLGEGPRNLASLVLATAFAEIWLQPTGTVGPLGVGVETTFLRGALDRLGVEPEFEQRYEYKNAADRLLRTGLTPAHREATDRLAGSVFEDAVAVIAAGRGLSEGEVRGAIDRGLLTAPEALEARLVDRLGYRDQVYAATRAAVQGASGSEPELLFADRWQPRRRLRPHIRRRGQVGLVAVRGAIATGRSRSAAMGRQAGSDTVSAQLRAALRDEHVRSVVLHVDSPGGSAVASDVIWREVCRVREAGKPVVVAMGEVAGSGGYYVACPADVIVALPATLTGSIGVFGGKLVVHELLERVGLTTGTVERGDQALMYSARRRFSEPERERLAASVDAVYEAFVAKVAAGRGRPVGEIEPIARGRIWTGQDARELGLVDELGGLRDAVRIARGRAGLPDDAPVEPVGQVPPLARLGRPKNSEDRRAAGTSAWLELSDLAAELGLPAGLTLRMPPLTLS